MREPISSNINFAGKAMLWLWIAAITFLPISVAIYTQSVSLAGLLLVCLVLGVFLSRIDLIEEITIGPMKAKLQRRIDQAEDVLLSLQNVAATIAEISLSTMIRTGATGGFNKDESEGFRVRVVKLLHDIGVENSAVMAAQRELVGYLKWEYVWALTGRSGPPNGVTDEQFSSWKELTSGQTKLPTVGSIRSYLRSINALDEEATQLLNDYTHFMQTGNHRRPEVFYELRGKPRKIALNSGVE